MKNCSIILTDSGGMQKEAYFFRKYCLTLRQETEWIELVNNHYNILTGANKEGIISSFKAFNNKEIPNNNSLYGDGNASMKIVDSIIDY
jgi:UDP-GlcNAc3NAcA epimerase